MKEITGYLQLDYKRRYTTFNDRPPTRVHPVLKDEQTLRMCNALWYECNTEQENIWRRIDDKIETYGFTSYYDFWLAAKEQGDEHKLPYYFIWQ